MQQLEKENISLRNSLVLIHLIQKPSKEGDQELENPRKKVRLMEEEKNDEERETKGTSETLSEIEPQRSFIIAQIRSTGSTHPWLPAPRTRKEKKKRNPKELDTVN
ncbi:hypothetical protein CleRT_14430 [Candidatus Coxiella mudrowiae]|uniref:Cytosolic protein n=1 Tax=Candidatus Coxiella mudrowiae TaxID=2054173 RepID=A0ABM5UVG6_9COXI|nr:hypothetical protein CleRT_14430 [Candidatus Coxiella mudrowiae]